jgi:hypothetical protein
MDSRVGSCGTGQEWTQSTRVLPMVFNLNSDSPASETHSGIPENQPNSAFEDSLWDDRMVIIWDSSGLISVSENLPRSAQFLQLTA